MGSLLKNFLQGVSLMVIMSSCATLKDAMVSPGRIQRDSISEGLQPLYEARNLPDLPLEIIGHGAGSYRYYPMSVKKGKYVQGNKWKDCNQPVKNINDLLNEAFAIDSMMSVEIDVQAPPNSHLLCQDDRDCLFVMHNQVKWSKVKSLESEATIYMLKNTIGQTLRHFVNQKYYRNKRLYLEVKAQPGCHSPGSTKRGCGDVSARLANEIQPFLKEVNQDSTRKNDRWLSIISFSARALKEIREALPDHLKDQVDYVLIAGIDPQSSWLGLKWLLGQAKGSVPMFNKEMREFVIRTPWLDRVWFSTQGIPKFEKVFSNIASERSAQCQDCHPLDLSVAVYPLKQEAFVKKISATDSSFRLSLKSMMIDIDDKCK